MSNDVRICVHSSQPNVYSVIVRLRVRGPSGPWRIADCRMAHISLRGAIWEALDWAEALAVSKASVWVGRKCLLDHPELLRIDRQLRLSPSEDKAHD